MTQTRNRRVSAKRLGMPLQEFPKNMVDEPRYVMSVASRLVDMTPQSIRACEREGLLEPARSSGRQRLYAERDIERLRRIKTLVTDMGVNMAGVEVALRLMDRIAELEHQLGNAIGSG
ncbi:MAG: MerR family transcriptional regulator [Dehalococcoidia bacterium]|nr:MerR family transcriptional regulator [Dehalococcoidia bacterium]